MLACWMCIFFGMLGVHKFVEKNIKWGLIYFFTGGLFIFGWLYDIFKYYKKYKEMGGKKLMLYKLIAVAWVLLLFGTGFTNQGSENGTNRNVVQTATTDKKEKLENDTDKSAIQTVTTDEKENLSTASTESASTESDSTESDSKVKEESDLQSKDDIGLTWESLLADNIRYERVLMLLGENFRAGEVNTTLKSNLSSDEIVLVDKLFSYCDSYNDLPEELKETFTTFCKSDKYKDMFFEDDNEFYNAVSKGFEIGRKSDGTYHIHLYMIPETDYSADKNYLDAERYVDNGCVLYIFENGQYEKYATVEDVIYGEIVDDVCYGFGIKLDFVDKELNVEEYKDGDWFFNMVRSEDGTPKYYVSVYDLNRRAEAILIDYEECWNWKPLADVSDKKGLNVYMGMGSCKRYQFSILDSKATADYMLVRFPDGSEEVKSYFAMISNQYLYVMED